MTSTSLEVIQLLISLVAVILGSVMVWLHVGDLLFVYRWHLNDDKPTQAWERASVSCVLVLMALLWTYTGWQRLVFTSPTEAGQSIEAILAIQGIVAGLLTLLVSCIRLYARYRLQRRVVRTP